VDFGTPWDKDAIAEMSKQRLQSTSTMRANGSPGSNLNRFAPKSTKKLAVIKENPVRKMLMAVTIRALLTQKLQD